MPRLLDIKNSFVSGEISPLLLGRTDLAKYSTACESIVNFVTRVQGGLSRRPGFRYINPILGPGKLIPFIFNSDNSYVLAIVNLQIYFYTKQAPINDQFGAPYFIASPWLVADDLELIKYTQIGDTMYLVHPKYPVQKLNRLTDNHWVLNQPRFNAKPATQQDEDISGGIISISSMGPVVTPINDTVIASVSKPTFIGTSFGTLSAPTDIGKVLAASGGTANIVSLQGMPFLHNDIVNHVVVGWRYEYAQANIKITAGFGANNYNAGAWSINGRNPNAILGLSGIQPALFGDESIVLSTPAFIGGDVGKEIIAGVGVAQIVSLGGSTSTDSITGATLFNTANVIVVDDFEPGITTYPPGAWFLRNGPNSYFSPGTLETVTPVTDVRWHGSNQFGVGSLVPIRTLNVHPTDYSFQESTGTTYIHILYKGTTTDTFRVSDVGRYVVFSGGYGQIISIGTGPPSIPGAVIPDGSTAATVLILNVPKVTESDAQGNLLIAPGFPGSWFFEDPAFSTMHGFPGAVCFFQQRLFFSGTDSNPQTIWGSVIEDFENFAKGTLDDDGIEIEISSGVFDRILWMQPYLGNIIAGTNRGEYTVGGGGNADVGQNTTPMTPTNIVATFQSAYGVTGVQPSIIQESLFYVQRLQLNVYEMEFDIQTASYNSKDLTLLNNLITKTPFLEMAYQQNQSKIIWFIAADPIKTSDGNLIGKNLIGLTYDKSEQVAGWHRHRSGALIGEDSFISMAVIPNSVDGAIVDELWVMMKRVVLGLPDTYTIELLDQSLYVDYATHRIFNSPVTKIGDLPGDNLSYLLGETVYVVADGALLPPIVMDNFGVYLFPPGFSAMDVQVGINFLSRALTVRPETRGTAQGIIKRWNRIWLRVYNSLGLRVNGQFIPNRIPENPMSTGVPLFTGDEDIINLGYDRDGRVEIEQNNPLPAEVLAMFGQLLIGEM